MLFRSKQVLLLCKAWNVVLVDPKLSMDNGSAYNPIFGRDNKKPRYFHFCAFVKIAAGTIFTA